MSGKRAKETNIEIEKMCSVFVFYTTGHHKWFNSKGSILFPLVLCTLDSVRFLFFLIFFFLLFIPFYFTSYIINEFRFLEISSHGPFKEEYFILIYRTGYACDAMGNHSRSPSTSSFHTIHASLVCSFVCKFSTVLFANAKLA